MAGQRRAPGDEIRDERVSVRLTKSEKQLLEEVQQAEGITYLADVIRAKALTQIRLEKIADGRSGMLAAARERLNTKSDEETIWALAVLQLKQEHPDIR